MSTNADNKAKFDYIYELDIIRLVTAVLVVLYHFGGYPRFFRGHDSWRTPDQAFAFLPNWTHAGWVGVQIFFVISGYVIAHSARQGSATTFLKSRLIRVLPGLWIMASVTALMRVAGGDSLHAIAFAWLKNVLLSPVGPYVDGVAWSLVVEVIFYGLVVLAIYSGRYRSREDMVKWLGLGLLLASGAFNLLEFYAKTAHSEGLYSLLGRYFWNLTLLRPGILFSLGIALSRLGDGHRDIGTKLWFGVAVVLSLGQAFLHQQVDLATNWAGMLIFVLAMGWMMIAIFTDQGTYRLMPHALTKGMGQASYLVYLGHYELACIAIAALPLGLLDSFNRVPLFLAAITGVLLLAFLVSKYAEQPVRRHLARLLLNRR